MACNAALAKDIADNKANLDQYARENKEEGLKFDAAILRLFVEKEAVQEKLDAADARILELEKLVDERNGRIVHLEETRDELECQVYDVQRRLDKANVANEAAREE